MPITLPRVLLKIFARSVPPSKPDPRTSNWLTRSTSGAVVTEDTALTLAAVWACVRVISQTVAQLPWHVYRPTRGGVGRERVLASPVGNLLQNVTNPETPAYHWRETLLGHALLWGNGLAEIVRDQAGRPTAMWLIEPDRWRLVRDKETGALGYEVSSSGGQPPVILSPGNVFHLRGLGFDGLQGYSVVSMARNSLGLGLSMDQFGGSFFGQGTWPAGVLTMTKTLSEPAKERFKKQWKESYQGAKNQHQIALLEEGMEWKPLTMNPEDAQFLESRQFQVGEVARWFGVPPHKIADLERATFSNIEEQQIAFVVDTIVPWLARLEAEAGVKLLPPGQFSKIEPAGLLRGDVERRYKAYATGRQWGWFSANDIRGLEDLNPIGAAGDVYLVPSNMAPSAEYLERERNPQAQAPTAPAPVAPDPDEPDPAASLRGAHHAMIEACWRDCWRRGLNAATAAGKRHKNQDDAITAADAVLSGPGHRSYCARRFEDLVGPLFALYQLGDATRRLEVVNTLCDGVAAHAFESWRDESEFDSAPAAAVVAGMLDTIQFQATARLITTAGA